MRKEKRCPKCGETKSASEFGSNVKQASGLQVYCKPCNRAYKKPNVRKYNRQHYLNHVEKHRETARAYYHANKDARAEYSKMRYQANRESILASEKRRGRARKIKVMEGYGGTRCVCCGESELAFLTLDHIEPCGRKGRREWGLGQQMYNALIQAGFPEGFRVLCFNCNSGRHVNGGVCPHEETSSITA